MVESWALMFMCIVRELWEARKRQWALFPCGLTGPGLWGDAWGVCALRTFAQLRSIRGLRSRRGLREVTSTCRRRPPGALQGRRVFLFILTQAGFHLLSGVLPHHAPAAVQTDPAVPSQSALRVFSCIPPSGGVCARWRAAKQTSKAALGTGTRMKAAAAAHTLRVVERTM